MMRVSARIDSSDSVIIPPEVPEQFVVGAEAPVSDASAPRANQWAVLAGVRFVLAFIVMCHHLPSFTSSKTGLFEQIGRGGAFAAVAAFFIISGYSMAHSLSHNDSARAFYERRFWRIYPCYLWALALSMIPALLFAKLLVNVHPGFHERPDGHQLLYSIFFLQGLVMGALPANGVIWSLSVEVWLYLLSPLFFRAGLKHLYAIIAVSLAAYLAHDYVSRLPYWAETHGVNLACYAWTFVGGFAFYRFRERFGSYWTLALASVALICYYQAGSQEQYGPLTMAGVVTAIYYGDRWKISAIGGKWLSWLGDLSLCLYLVHIPVMNTLHGIGWTSGPALVAACLAFAILTYYVVDLPVRGFVRRRNMPRKGLDLSNRAA